MKKGTTIMKTYQKPTTEMIILNAQQMVCASGTETISTEKTVDQISDLQSRRSFNVWGDDEEEE